MEDVMAYCSKLAGNVLRVDLGCLLTNKPRRSYLSRDFLDDSFGGLYTCDYGDMLSQHLRRIEGVGVVRIEHYGFEAEIGRAYGFGEILGKIKAAVEFVLWHKYPWIVTRDGSGFNWRYTFGEYLTAPGCAVEVGPNQQSYLTDFGCQVLQGLAGISDRARVDKVVDGTMIMDIIGQRPSPQEWRGAIDPMWDVAVTESVGSRDIRVVWDEL